MIPILLCSVIAVAIIVERSWTLRHKKVIPEKLLTGIWNLLNKDALTDEHISEIENGSLLGRVLAAGLINRHLSRDMIRESIEENGRHVVHGSLHTRLCYNKKFEKHFCALFSFYLSNSWLSANFCVQCLRLVSVSAQRTRKQTLDGSCRGDETRLRANLTPLQCSAWRSEA